MMNRLVTRGMGRTRGRPGRAGLVTQGYTGVFKAVVDAVTVAVSTVVQGGTKALKRLPEILWTVYARLASVNDRELLSGAEGVDRRVVDPNLPNPQVEADLESAGINRRPSGIVIVAEHVRHGKKEGLK